MGVKECGRLIRRVPVAAVATTAPASRATAGPEWRNVVLEMV